MPDKWEILNPNNKDSWCVNAENALCSLNDGTTKPCCMYKQDRDVKYPVLGETPLQGHMEFPEFVEVREWLRTGRRHRNCESCWAEERAGRVSKRIRDNENYFEHVKNVGKLHTGLVKLELNLGNTCNIKCRTCHPSTSSTWMKEDHAVNKKDIMDYKYYKSTLEKYWKSYEEDSMFWKDLENNLHNITKFDFYGGEPFMSKKMWEVIKLARDKGYAKDIFLQYNSNCTLWPEESLEAWKDFQHVNLNFSVDGIGERFEFMRHPAKWDVAENTWEKAKQFSKKHSNLKLGWCITLSTLNIYYLPETLDYFLKNFNTPDTRFGLYLNLVHGPEYFNISIMPGEIKNIISDRLNEYKKTIDGDYENITSQIEGVIRFMNNRKSKLDVWDEFFKRVEAHDLYRNESYPKIFKEFYDIIK